MTRWYNAIDCTNTVDHPFVGQRFDFRGRSPAILTRGKPINNWDSRAKLWTDNEEANGTPDDVLQHCLVAIPIFSERLRQALENVEFSGIQYLDVQLLRPDGMVISGYSIANITNLVPALDTEKSILTRFGESRPDRAGQISGVLKPVLKGHVAAGFDIFRLTEFPLRYYVSERFREIVIQGGFTGYSFKEVPLS